MKLNKRRNAQQGMFSLRCRRKCWPACKLVHWLLKKSHADSFRSDLALLTTKSVLTSYMTACIFTRRGDAPSQAASVVENQDAAMLEFRT